MPLKGEVEGSQQGRKTRLFCRNTTCGHLLTLYVSLFHVHQTHMCTLSKLATVGLECISLITRFTY